MKAFCLTVLVCFLFQGAEEKPKVLDWSLIPVSGDKDYAEAFSKAQKEYHGKKVIAEGTLFKGARSNQREITVELYQQTTRGQLTVLKVVSATFRDVRQEPIRALANRKATVKVIGVVTRGDPLHIDDAQLLVEPKTKVELKAKPAPKKADSEAAAAAKLSLCKQLLDLGKHEAAKFRLEELVRDYPMTKAAEEAKALLKKL